MPRVRLHLDADTSRKSLRCIFTFNIRDFIALAQAHPQHRGVLLAAQQSWSVSDLIRSLDQFLSETDATEVEGQVLWLNRWRQGQQ
jgi:hypothetical protein